MGDDQNVLTAVGQFDGNQFVPFVQVHGNQTALANVPIFGQTGALGDPCFGDHIQIGIFIVDFSV